MAYWWPLVVLQTEGSHWLSCPNMAELDWLTRTAPTPALPSPFKMLRAGNQVLLKDDSDYFIIFLEQLSCLNVTAKIQTTIYLN
ncbi:hypothetical protein JOB18_036810 [Solea senegalensis]|uniref:Uncharacterized protein n=1 Tax=Solea senegalensis TaxID=28829 RepID=A0AAV6QZD6_SOLSE|nr:hypothetical protein JOB18_036810 [Solea senegalensis]